MASPWQNGKPKCSADAAEMVQLVGRLVVTHVVAPVVGEPEILRGRIEVEAHAVAHAARDHLRLAASQVDPGDGRVQRGGRRADVARRADGNVELAVGTEGDELPAVVAVRGEGVAGHLGLGRARRGRGRRRGISGCDSPPRRRARRRETPRRWARAARWPATWTASALPSPSRSTTAYTLPSEREPTKTTPGGPSAIWRALGTSAA